MNTLWTIVLFAWCAFAQEPEVRLPEVTYAAQAQAPTDLSGIEGDQVVVQLEVDIGEEGFVLDARATEAPNDAFAAAAEDALLAYRFTPALVNGTPTAVTIVFSLPFAISRAPTLAIEGTVRRAGEKTLLPGATLELEGPEGVVTYAKSGDDGTFQVFDLASGAWTITPSGNGIRPDPIQVGVTEGVVTEVTLYVVTDRPWEADEADIEVVEVISRLGTAEVNERRIGTTEAMALPGTNGDVIKAIINFPGVARPPLGIGQLVVRGTEANATKYYVDGVRIPNVFHFGGLSTVLNGDGLAEIRFLTGNYSVRYGDGLGGVVDLLTTPKLPERSRGYVSVDVYQAAGFGEFKLGKSTSLILSARRSYADAVLGPILSGFGGGGTFQAPRYWDAQARVMHRTSNGGILDAQILFADDQFRLLQPDGGNVRFGLSNTFLTASIGYRGPIAERWRSETRISAGPERESFTANDQTSFDEKVAINFRQQFEREVTEDTFSFGWRGGFDVRASAERFSFGGFGTVPLEEGETWRIRPAMYTDATIRLGPVDLVPGLRGSVLTLPGTATTWSVDPRFALVGRAGPTTTLIGTVGRYSQDPESRELLPSSRGEPGLRPGWSLQSSVGVQQKLPLGFSLDITGYYNEMYDLVVGRGDRFDFTAGPPTPVPADEGPYANAGRGRAYGAEVLLRAEQDRVRAQVSMTIGRAERLGREDTAWQPFAFDQTFLVNMLATYQFPYRWTLGGRLRFGTGNPFYEVNNRAYGLQNRVFVPVYQSEVSRLRPYWSLDIRVDKTWVFKKWELTFYLDIQNITDPGNTELPGYTYDYSAPDPIRSTPPLPAFGLKGAW